MTSPGTGWAVDAVADADSLSTASHSLIMRFAECRWQPFGESLLTAQLESIAMVSSGDGWAAGRQGQGPLLLHYRDGTWGRITPHLAGDVHAFVDVGALSNGEVWVAGLTPAGARPSSGIALLHLAGGKWKRVETSLSDVTDIGPVGPGDVWLLAYKSLSVTNGMPELVHIQRGVV